MEVLVYDPNYREDSDHYVHAKKAVSDAIPEVQRLLQGTGITLVPQAELFGHGLQTLLGTTETKQRGWFSSTVYTTQRGYPICGAVVYLLAWVWLAVAGGGAALDDIRDVEEALAEIVKEEEGKLAIQRKISVLLQDLTKALSTRGQDPFQASMRRRLDTDWAEIVSTKDWPADVVRKGGSI